MCDKLGSARSIITKQNESFDIKRNKTRRFKKDLQYLLLRYPRFFKTCHFAIIAQ